MEFPELIRSYPTSLSAINGSFSETVIEVRPNQSMNRQSFGRVRAVFIAVTVLVAGFSFIQGNWFAPLFALINVLILSFIFELVWRGQDFEERLAYVNGRILVETRHGQRMQKADFDPLWVRFEADPQKNCAGLLVSHGIQFRLGGFLNPEQRKLLASRMQELLSRAREAALALNISNNGRQVRV
ncbi:DUF2244 domain-containing protein [bacterium]|nr:DUF2244 domain-containing protein [bacterium]